MLGSTSILPLADWAFAMIVATRRLCTVAVFCWLGTMTAHHACSQMIPLPAEVADGYEKKMDAGVSDDFGSIDPKKWVKRGNKKDPNAAAGNILASHNRIEQEGETRFLSLLASNDGEAGLSALNPHRYGFTVCRWRLRGIEKGKKFAAHPAIWSFSFNMGSVPKNSPNPNDKTIEIDWMEYLKWKNVPDYHARVIPAFKGKSDLPKSAHMFEHFTDFSGWKTYGLEYTPDHVQVWQHDSGTWKQLGVAVRFGDSNDAKEKTIDREHRSDQYFVLSNIRFVKDVYELTPVNLDIDYLHHYRMKKN